MYSPFLYPSNRNISEKLQIDVGKVNEEKTLLSAIVKNTQGEM